MRRLMVAAIFPDELDAERFRASSLDRFVARCCQPQTGCARSGGICKEPTLVGSQ